MMLASSIMTQLRRTTVSAPQSTIRTLEAEAQRRQVPLASLLREAVEEKAQSLRSRRRPRVGVARSTDGRSAADVTSEPVAEAPR
jgi:Ribbon-helix-helix protein, copG family